MLRIYLSILFLSDSMKPQMRELLEWTQTFGMLSFKSHKEITNYNISFEPFYSTRDYYDLLTKRQKIWHELFHKISKDHKFIINLFEPLQDQDDTIRRLLNIYKKSVEHDKKDGIAFSRLDYYNNLDNQPKMTQYNLYSIGMQSNQEQYQQAKKLLDTQKHLYAGCATIKSWAQTIDIFKTKKQLKGMLLFVHLNHDSNFFDQKRLELEFMNKNIKVKRATIQQMYHHISRDEQGNLFYDKQLVSFVYYRSGYRMKHFQIDGNADLGWQMKEDIELSNAYTIPPISMELINQKRMQTQLSKPEILKRYLSQQDAEEIHKCYVKEWDFDNISEQNYQKIIDMIKEKPEDYILKPNAEGGGNNYFGIDALNKLQSTSKEEAKAYIVMQKIYSKATPNCIINGQSYTQNTFVYEVSRYGSFCWENQNILDNQTSGFLLRSKPQKANEGGIMTGIGAITPWKFYKE